MTPIEALRQTNTVKVKKAKKLKTSRLRQKLFGFEDVLAVKNYKRNAKRSRTVVFALCGSFCTFETVLPQIIRLRACGWEVLPMLSYAASALDTRFGRAADWKQRLEEATGHRPLEDLRGAEPLGPKHMAQALVIAPCTGTTMALLAAGISATPVTLAAKSMLRGGRPVVIGVSTNDGLSGSVGALAALLQRKNYYFIPFGQDDSYKKPCSLKADFTQLPDTLEAALRGVQLQPILL